jgi:hypothetical protein
MFPENNFALISPIYASCPACLIPLHLTTLIMFGDEWKLQFANPKENAFSEILWKTVWLLIDTKRI